MHPTGFASLRSARLRLMREPLARSLLFVIALSKRSVIMSDETEKNRPSKPDEPLLRGALKLEASTSTPIVSAGTEFSIYVVIRNPFPVPVTIYSTETHIPVELSDEIWRQTEKIKLRQERLKQIGEITTASEKFRTKVGYWLSDIYSWLRPASSPRVAIAVTPEVQEAISRPIANVTIGNVSVDSGGIEIIAGSKWELNFGELSPDEVRTMLWDINEYIQGRKPVVLRPGDSVVKHFVLKTSRWLTFTPIAHTFQIQVRYEIDGQAHVDTVPFSLNIRAATASALIGAILGSILGSVVNSKVALNDMQSAARVFLTSSIFAIIIVVAFARKNNVQQIVSVEDFWGGMFIGFLVGYSGETFINSVIGKPGG